MRNRGGVGALVLRAAGMWALAGLVVLSLARRSTLAESAGVPSARSLLSATGPFDEVTRSLTDPVPPAASATRPFQQANVEYDGRFTFVRLRFDVGFSGFGRRGGGVPGWAHDYPRAERNLMKILDETTLLTPHLRGTNIFAMDEPELYKYPFAYVSEPGGWTMNDDEEKGIGDYLLKGGFLIFDDFGGLRDWSNFEDKIGRALPDAQLVELDSSHPIFNSFFEITEDAMRRPTYRSPYPRYYGVFEDNDRGKRLMLIANFDNDIGDYWEWSESGFLPIELSNEAYKLGVNYIVYAMTH